MPLGHIKGFIIIVEINSDFTFSIISAMSVIYEVKTPAHITHHTLQTSPDYIIYFLS